MTQRLRILLARLGILLFVNVASGCSPEPQPKLETYPVPFRKPYRSDDYAFLKKAIGDRSIVQLGESIHVTNEFPRARLPLIRFLHEEMGFDVLAFEGSPIEAWLAEEHLRASAGTATQKISRAQELAWFGLWQTEAMREILAYVAATKNSPKPLYLSSFDLQPGTGRAFGGKSDLALADLFNAMLRYEKPPGEDTAYFRVYMDMEPFEGCYDKEYKRPTAKQEATAREAINFLVRWIELIVERKAMLPVHAAALNQIPAMLERRIDLCKSVPQRKNGYQFARDRLMASAVLALRNDVSQSHRIILWAHHSHIHHNSLRKALPPMGQYLNEQMPTELYTIGLFAGAGRALEVDDAGLPPIRPRNLRAASSYDFEGALQELAPHDYFVDFSSLTPKAHPGWFAESSTRMEARGKRKVAAARDFHAAVFIHEVSPADLLFLPQVFRTLLTIYRRMLDHALLLVASFVLILFFLDQPTQNSCTTS